LEQSAFKIERDLSMRTHSTRMGFFHFREAGVVVGGGNFDLNKEKNEKGRQITHKVTPKNPLG